MRFRKCRQGSSRSCCPSAVPSSMTRLDGRSGTVIRAVLAPLSEATLRRRVGLFRARRARLAARGGLR